MNEFKVGDKVECIKNELYADSLTVGKSYAVVESDEFFIKIYDDEKEFYKYRKFRFKLAEPEPQYFSALNASEAEQYIGKTMEFADGAHAKEEIWYSDKLEKIKKADYPFKPFKTLGRYQQFCRTCPETFKRNLVKKTVVGWLNIYDDGEQFFHASKWEANDCGKYRDKIACVKLTGEYEIEE